jgi:hypothetical protein
MGTEAVKAMVRQWVAAVNAGDAAAAATLTVPGGGASSWCGPAEHVSGDALLTTYRMALPDLHLTYTDLVAEDDTAMLRCTVRGTHRGRLLGIAPTGKAVTFHGILVFEIVGGAIGASWFVVDRLDLLEQLGGHRPVVTSASA